MKPHDTEKLVEGNNTSVYDKVGGYTTDGGVVSKMNNN